MLQPVPPFRLDLTIWTLRRRPDHAVDRWDGRTYRRVLVLDGLLVEVAVMQIKPPGDPHLRVTVNGPPLTADVRAEEVAHTLARWRDYGGLIYFHLLLDRLAEIGHLEGGLRCSI